MGKKLYCFYTQFSIPKHSPTFDIIKFINIIVLTNKIYSIFNITQISFLRDLCQSLCLYIISNTKAFANVRHCNGYNYNYLN